MGYRVQQHAASNGKPSVDKTGNEKVIITSLELEFSKIDLIK
jgi:hypothetical protein